MNLIEDEEKDIQDVGNNTKKQRFVFSLTQSTFPVCTSECTSVCTSEYAPNKWDLRFLSLAKEVSTWSKDPHKKCGAIIVRPDKTIVSMGYNGFPKNMSDDPKLYENRQEKYSRIIHAEMNALLHTREDLKDYTMYTYPLGLCDRCCVHAIEKGITKFVFPRISSSSKWIESINKTKKYCDDMYIPYVEIDFE
jgi:dCMP deaminase